MGPLHPRRWHTAGVFYNLAGFSSQRALFCRARFLFFETPGHVEKPYF